MTKRLSRRSKKTEFTPTIRSILSSGVDFFRELDYLIDTAMIAAELRRLRKNWQENADRIRELEDKHSGNFWDADPNDPRVVFLRKQWGLHRDAVMQYHIKKFPGSRPWGFWFFDHPGERPFAPDAPDGPLGVNSEQQKVLDLKFLLQQKLLSPGEEKAIRTEDASAAAALDGSGAIDEGE